MPLIDANAGRVSQSDQQKKVDLIISPYNAISSEESMLSERGLSTIGASTYIDDVVDDEVDIALAQARKVGADAIILGRRPIALVTRPVLLEYPMSPQELERGAYCSRALSPSASTALCHSSVVEFSSTVLFVQHQARFLAKLSAH